MLKINWWRSLRVQSFIAVMAFGFLLICLFIFYALPEQARWVNDGLSSAAQRSLQQLSTSIKTPLLTRQYAQLYEQIDAQLNTNPNWKAIRVVEPTTGNQLYPLDEWQLLAQQGNVTLNEHITFLDKPLAEITLVVNFVDEINEAAKLHYTLIYIQFFILVVFFIGLAWLVDYRITSPLRALEVAFSKLAKGNFDCHVSVQQKNEIGSVINAFNKMAGEVATNHQKVNALRIQAESASKAKSDFMASMSHELRTPLNAILGLAQLYQYDSKATEVHKDNAQSIYQAGEHLLLLINDVLDLTSIESGNMQFNFEYAPVKDMLQHSIEMVSELARVELVTINTHNIDSLEGIYLYVDKRRFKQVLLNLLSNAIKYNKVRGKIDIRCEIADSSRCNIDIEDTGCGFSEDDILRLFKPFDRLGAETSKTHGTGIGLVITKELVERMQGQLQVNSQINKGACFTISFNSFKESALTTIQADEPINHPSSEPADSATGKLPVLNVLVAEDQLTNQQVLKQQLTMLGVNSTFANNGEQAWQMLQDKSFDMLLTDIQMPLLNGLELAKKIRKNTQFNELIIIAVTANIMEKNIQDCYSAGMNGFLTKPIELESLKALLMKHSQGIVPSHTQPLQITAQASSMYSQLDMPLLFSMLGKDTHVHCLVFQAFLQTAYEQVKLIEAYTHSLNYADLSFQAHGLKSSAKSVAALKLSDTCQQIESLAAQNKVDEALLFALQTGFNEVVTQLKVYCNKHEASS
ncbi:ATP-binding protein [Pseudoalteromonas sp. S2893]|uniref:ATP-binding protein n=1 Tax=Pseudoalteromonas sp. S2893 TaxID=579530 RepID=UPI00110B1EDD|nr:ATP-binding protein [Pseudoalteromonas sp. S2893]TMP19784.1 hybrid sensor histidine kinase/response regulator [Pseudoalteromonas sp. S2893]